jgi:hypothetical protein
MRRPPPYRPEGRMALRDCGGLEVCLALEGPYHRTTQPDEGQADDGPPFGAARVNTVPGSQGTAQKKATEVEWLPFRGRLSS